MSQDLIRCGDHKLAPWSIVCIHLINGTSQEWTPVQQPNDSGEFDWVCPDCDAKMDEGIVSMVPLLRPVCIHCVRKLRGV